ncbi:hypothetical protein HELRODRAFT_153615, partial [Helobdella robusta]|uniref:RING-type E3 ubiquitin transferase n=1 Tax=Helobdella robusta TaxID=6412 RepID=T1ELA0_HELRO
KFLNESCSICSEDFIEKSFVCELQCRHVYHFACIRLWLLKKSSCPFCRQAI